MEPQTRILTLNEREMHGTVSSALLDQGYSVYTASDISEARQLLNNKPVDLFVTGIQLQDGSGLEFVKKNAIDHPTLPVIIVTGFPSTEYIKAAEKLDVLSFLVKPVTENQIRCSVMGGLERLKIDAMNHKPEGIFDGKGDVGLIGTSQYIVNLRDHIKKVAWGNFPVLILGPSGTGKDIIANAIHRLSLRTAKHIVTVNCGAIPKNLEEAEFFGYTTGSFTGALFARQGIMATADNSTLFLDEVGELSLGMQAKLLRVLENGEFMRIGETTPRTVDVRIVSASNSNLEEMIARGEFREDLYYRIKGDVITTFPLNKHSEDIPVLVDHFMRKESAPRPSRLITSEAMALLANHMWTGNIRELKTTISLLCHAAVGSKQINPDIIEAVMGIQGDRTGWWRAIILKRKKFLRISKQNILHDFSRYAVVI
jgi:DNA-binding NtrC family response regulator